MLYVRLQKKIEQKIYDYKLKLFMISDNPLTKLDAYPSLIVSSLA